MLGAKPRSLPCTRKCIHLERVIMVSQETHVLRDGHDWSGNPAARGHGICIGTRRSHHSQLAETAFGSICWVMLYDSISVIHLPRAQYWVACPGQSVTRLREVLHVIGIQTTLHIPRYILSPIGTELRNRKKTRQENPTASTPIPSDIGIAFTPH